MLECHTINITLRLDGTQWNYYSLNILNDCLKIWLINECDLTSIFNYLLSFTVNINCKTL